MRTFATIFFFFQEAKKYALETANSEDPNGLYNIIMYEFHTKKPYQYSLKKKFFTSMLTSTKIKKLESFANSYNERFKAYSSEKKIDENSIDELDTKSFNDLYINMLISGQIESDYDYSLPDGGITETITKTITKTDTETETKTKMKTETDETITKTITKTKTKTDGSVMLPDVLDTNEFKKYLSLAKENGLIKDVNGKLEWIQIGNRGGSSQLAYFLGRAFGYIHSENGNNNEGDEFPGDELDELFGVTRIYRLLVQVHSASKPQKWRRKIDELFEQK